MKFHYSIILTIHILFSHSISQVIHKSDGFDLNISNQAFDNQSDTIAIDSKKKQATEVTPKSMIRRVCLVIGGSAVALVGGVMIFNSDEVHCNNLDNSMCNQGHEGKKENAAIPANIIIGAIVSSAGIIMIWDGFRK